MPSQEESRGGARPIPPPADLQGMEVRDPSGTPAGNVEDVYVDRQDGTPRYVAVGAISPGKHYLVPISIVRVEDSGGGVAWLVTACEVEQLRGAPAVDQDALVTLPHEEQVTAYFRDLHGAGYMRPWAEPPQLHGAGYMRPEDEPPEVHGAGYMRPEDEPPEAGAAGRMDPKFLSTVKRWRE